MECTPLDLWVAAAAAVEFGDGDGEAVAIENHAAR
jgi:hypothetical protein